MSRLLVLLLACLAVAAGGCGGDDEEPASTPVAEASAEPTQTPEDTGGEQESGCAPAEKSEPRREDVAKPRQRLDPAKTYVATVTTSCGDFEITLDAKRAPRTGGSFKYLADKGFFDGLTFHRIVAGFVIQGGDPAGNGQGGPGYSVVEAPPSGLTYTNGVVAMAKTQTERPGTSGSQFFVVTAENAELPPDYALLGKVTMGQEVVDRIGVVPTTADEQPAEPIVIRSIDVAER